MSYIHEINVTADSQSHMPPLPQHAPHRTQRGVNGLVT